VPARLSGHACELRVGRGCRLFGALRPEPHRHAYLHVQQQRLEMFVLHVSGGGLHLLQIARDRCRVRGSGTTDRRSGVLGSCMLGVRLRYGQGVCRCARRDTRGLLRLRQQSVGVQRDEGLALSRQQRLLIFRQDCENLHRGNRLGRAYV
jgi:hypothetical protein